MLSERTGGGGLHRVAASNNSFAATVAPSIRTDCNLAPYPLCVPGRPHR
ncbi:hypothetical protein [Streptomyces sp. NBC_00401]|nr:hypothetical protein [Streptomyces sp. NBC_00401]